MVFDLMRKVAAYDPTGITGMVVDTAEDITDYGGRAFHGIIAGGRMEIDGVMVEIDTMGAANLLYDALVPNVAQAVLGGRLPTSDDVRDDAIAWIGGPLQGIYVAANSKSAHLIANGEAPDAEQLGKDMIAALTPIAKRRIGL